MPGWRVWGAIQGKLRDPILPSGNTVRSRNHMTLYNISLGVLELLKPFVFRPEYADALVGRS